MFQVNTMVLIIMVVLVTYRGDADPTISTSTPTPCYGDVVTLVCHHPEVVSNRTRYFTQTPLWKENDAIITIADGTIYTDETVADLTRTFLNINVTVDHFRNKSFNYSCLLQLAENGRPTGEVETSGVVTVDPVDQLPTPMNIATFSNSTTAVLTVSFDPQCCNTAQLKVNVTTTSSSSATTPVVLPVDSTDPTNTTIVITDITEGVSYTASIWSVCRDVNSLLEDSGVLVVNFMTYDDKDPNMNGTDSTGQPSSPATTTVLVWLPIAIVIILMVVVYCTVMTVTVTYFLRRKRNHGGQGIPAGEGIEADE